MGFLLVLVTLGSVREAIGAGTLFANAHLMFGEDARSMLLTLGDDYPGFLLAVLPPGAFIGLGLLIAIKNHIDKRMASTKPAVVAEMPSESPAS
jgi:electron transport complex protein RnfE